jgi:hypothetical protein
VRYRQRPQRLGGDPERVGHHRQLAALGGHHLAVDEHEIAEIDIGLPRDEFVGADAVLRQHHLQLGVALAQHREAQPAGVPDEDHPPGDADLLTGLGAGGEFREPRPHLGQRRGPRDLDRERRAIRVGQ